MTKERAKIRLFVDLPLGQAQSVPLSRDQAHYLNSVMRRGIGDQVALFNGRDGEWTAEIADIGKRRAMLTCLEQAAPQLDPPDLWLLFAPIKKARTAFIVEKATELGVSRILPVQTQYTNSDRVNQDRLQAHAMEAAEQCGGTFVPDVAGLQPLETLLGDWDETRQILYCDETLSGLNEAFQAAGSQAQKWAILIGPEGGFSPEEKDMLMARKYVHAISLGPRILRADTAAVAAITLWQQAMGDW